DGDALPRAAARRPRGVDRGRRYRPPRPRHGHVRVLALEPFPSEPHGPVGLRGPAPTLDLAHEGDEDLAALLHLHRRGLLSWDDVHRFRETGPGNPKLRAMIGAVMERGVWKLAWLPPSLPYTTPGGPFATEGARS